MAVLSAAGNMLRGRRLVLTYWTIAMVIAAVNCGDNTIYSSQYRRFVNEQSVQQTTHEQAVRNWLQCGSLCSRMGLDCLGYNLLANQPNDTYPYMCEIKGLPLVKVLKIPNNGCVYYDLRLEGPYWIVRTDACLPGHDDDTLDGFTLNECWRRCLTRGPNSCNSIDYDHTIKKCFMTGSSASNTGQVLASPCSVDPSNAHWFTYVERSLVGVLAGNSSSRNNGQ